MTTRDVSAEWLGGYRVNVTAGPFEQRVDEPETVGGDGTGPQPTDLLLASVASCFVLALVYAARKRDVRLSSVSVAVTGTYDGPRFSDIAIEVSGLPEEQADGLIASAERVCYVTNTLRRPPAISIRYT
jgi:putative redox protein